MLERGALCSPLFLGAGSVTDSAASDASASATFGVVGLLVNDERSADNAVGTEEVESAICFLNDSDTGLVSDSHLKVTGHLL